MHFARSRTASFIAAGLLSVLTLAIFYILRNYGPAQAINLFHAAALSGDQSEIARVTVQPPTSRKVQWLEALVRHARAIQVVSVTQNPGEATFIIAYRVQEGQVTIHWVVDQSANSGWLIDVDKTLTPQTQ